MRAGRWGVVLSDSWRTIAPSRDGLWAVVYEYGHVQAVVIRTSGNKRPDHWRGGPPIPCQILLASGQRRKLADLLLIIAGRKVPADV